jgi:hypothetical protein
MMLRGLWKLTWIEIKVFLREPMGAFGTIVFPVLIFLGLGRVPGLRVAGSSGAGSSYILVALPVLVSLLIAISAVLSLVTIISIYREGGILKRLRATPLRPQTILTAHVIVKLILTAATLALLPDRRPCSLSLVYDGAADQHLEHLFDRFFDCQHRSDGTIRAADRGDHPISDDRGLGSVRAGGVAAAGASRSGASAAVHLRSAAAPGDLEWRGVVGARWRCGGTGYGVSCLHDAVGEGFSLGVKASHTSTRS